MFCIDVEGGGERGEQRRRRNEGREAWGRWGDEAREGSAKYVDGKYTVIDSARPISVHSDVPLWRLFRPLPRDFDRNPPRSPNSRRHKGSEYLNKLGIGGNQSSKTRKQNESTHVDTGDGLTLQTTVNVRVATSSRSRPNLYSTNS